MVAVEEVFGVNAGKVWNALKNSGQMNVRKICEKTGLSVNEVFGALGWLAREGKISIIENGARIEYCLNE
jgi:DNA-binding GntR family transcriptional regulator